MPAVRARLGGRVEGAAARAARLRVVGVHLHVDVFEGLDRRVGRRAIAQVGDRHAVDEVVVAAACAAAKRQQRGVGLVLLPVELRVAGGDDGRHRDGKEERRPAAVGSVSSWPRSMIAACRGVGRIDQGRCAGDGDRLLKLTDIECDVQRDELLRADADVLDSRRS